MGNRDHSATKLALILSLLGKIYITPARNATRIALQAGGRSHWLKSSTAHSTRIFKNCLS